MIGGLLFAIGMFFALFLPQLTGEFLWIVAAWVVARQV